MDIIKKLFNKQSLAELFKEIARIAFFGAISAVLAWASTQIANLPPDSTYALAGAAVLRVLDRWVHETKAIKANGLAPF